MGHLDSSVEVKVPLMLFNNLFFYTKLRDLDTMP